MSAGWRPPRGFRPAVEFLLRDESGEGAVVSSNPQAVMLGDVDLSEYLERVSTSIEQEAIDVTTFGDAEQQYMPGQKRATAQIVLLGAPSNLLPIDTTKPLRLRVGDRFEADVVLTSVVIRATLGDLTATEVKALVVGTPIYLGTPRPAADLPALTIVASRRVRVRS